MPCLDLPSLHLGPGFPLAVQFPDGPRHNLGLSEVLLSLVWIPLVFWMGRKNRVDDPPPGSIMWTMAIAYAVPRFFLDFLRATDLPSCDVRHFGLTPAQYGCLVLSAGGGLFFVRVRPARGAP